MSRYIYLLLDYKGNFGYKTYSLPAYSGFNQRFITEQFRKEGFEVCYLYPSEVNLRDEWKGKLVLYTSTQDNGCLYKEYICDVLYALSLRGAILLPDMPFAKAHHNKVFMEMLRDIADIDEVKSIRSQHYGSLEEFDKTFDHLNDNNNWVLKSAAGASSLGVRLSHNKDELYKCVKELSNSPTSLIQRLKEHGRRIKYKGYCLDSEHRNKFIVQNFIEGLGNDWKVLVFKDKYYIVQRPNRKNDFRASGSGKQNYLFGAKAQIPDGIFDFAQRIYEGFNVPMISLDIALKDTIFHLIEMQFVAFGTSGHHYSKEYFQKENREWITVANTQTIEEIYVDSIVDYIKRNNL